MEGQSADGVIGAERVKRENSDAFRTLLSAEDDPVLRKVIAAIASEGTVTYNRLTAYIPTVTRKTIRRKVYTLRDAGIVMVSGSKPATITVANPAMELLTNDVLSYYY